MQPFQILTVHRNIDHRKIIIESSHLYLYLITEAILATLSNLDLLQKAFIFRSSRFFSFHFSSYKGKDQWRTYWARILLIFG